MIVRRECDGSGTGARQEDGSATSRARRSAMGRVHTTGHDDGRFGALAVAVALALAGGLLALPEILPEAAREPPTRARKCERSTLDHV